MRRAHLPAALSLAVACSIPAWLGAEEGKAPEAAADAGAARTGSGESPHYIDLLGSYLRPDSGRHTRSTGYGATFIYGAHLRGPFWVEGRLSGALLETGGSAGTDFYHYGGGVDLVATWGDRQGWTPFALVGAGGVYDDVQPDREDSFNFRGDFGAGLVSPAFTSRGLQLRAEGRGLYDTFESGQLDWQLSLGISIPLGRARVIERVVVREVRVEVPAAVPIDSDGDGVLDPSDQCPDTLAGGEVDSSGCLILGQTIVLDDVHFEHDSDRLTVAAQAILDGVAASLIEEPDVRFEIAGHTDSTGSDAYNDRLSQARAGSVMRFLTGRGMRAERMTARGYGESQPIDTNATSEGRGRNRRVEFRIHPRGGE